MCTEPRARKHAESFAEGFPSRKVSGSFVADMKVAHCFNLRRVKKHEEAITVEAERCYCLQEAQRLLEEHSKPADVAEGSRKLRGSVARVCGQVPT